MADPGTGTSTRSTEDRGTTPSNRGKERRGTGADSGEIEKRGFDQSPPESSPVSRIIPGAEANFTWADLKRVGSRLTLAPDSAWAPPELRDNVVATIRFALDPANAVGGVPLSQGVNVRDLYHAHIVYPRPRNEPIAQAGSLSGRERGPTKKPDCQAVLSKALLDRVALFLRNYRAALNDTRAREGPYVELDGRIVQPSAEERKAIQKADASVAVDLEETLKFLVKALPHAFMLYHSYEYIDVVARDAEQRHILTSFSGPKPAIGRYDNYAASSCQILQIDFLVSPQGKIFLRGGDSRSLAGLEFAPA